MASDERPAIVAYGTGGYIDDSDPEDVQTVQTAQVQFDNGVGFTVSKRDGEITEHVSVRDEDYERSEAFGRSGASPERWLWDTIEEYYRVDCPDGLVDASRLFPAAWGVADGQ